METLNILLIEDQAVHAEDLSKTLRNAGFKVVDIATNFAEAIASFISTEPDLIILDIELSGSKNGIEVAKQILSIRKLPIIVLTGYDKDEIFRKVKNIFLPAAYLLKPHLSKDLPRTVELAWKNFHLKSQPNDPINDHVFLPVDNAYQKILKSSVSYITTVKSAHSVHLYESHKKSPLIVNLGIGYIEDYFNDSRFYRVSRSLLINLEEIQRIEGNRLKFEGSDDFISIPEKHRPELMRRLIIARNPSKTSVPPQT
tara:strand:- start:246 stop:1013 length:768 start_codon:yes stop_codon:yes gene_type:complete